MENLKQIERLIIKLSDKDDEYYFTTSPYRQSCAFITLQMLVSESGVDVQDIVHTFLKSQQHSTQELAELKKNNQPTGDSKNTQKAQLIFSKGTCIETSTLVDQAEGKEFEGHSEDPSHSTIFTSYQVADLSCYTQLRDRIKTKQDKKIIIIHKILDDIINNYNSTQDLLIDYAKFYDMQKTANGSRRRPPVTLSLRVNTKGGIDTHEFITVNSEPCSNKKIGFLEQLRGVDVYDNNYKRKEPPAIIIMQLEVQTKQGRLEYQSHCYYNMRSLSKCFNGHTTKQVNPTEMCRLINNGIDEDSLCHFHNKNGGLVELSCDICTTPILMLATQSKVNDIPQELNIKKEITEDLYDDKMNNILNYFDEYKQGFSTLYGIKQTHNFNLETLEYIYKHIIENWSTQVSGINSKTNKRIIPIENLRNMSREDIINAMIREGKGNKGKQAKPEPSHNGHTCVRQLTNMMHALTMQNVANELFSGNYDGTLSIGGSPHVEKHYYKQMESLHKRIYHHITFNTDGIYDLRKYKDSVSKSDSKYSMIEDKFINPSQYSKYKDQNDQKMSELNENFYNNLYIRDSKDPMMQVTIGYANYKLGVLYALSEQEKCEKLPKYFPKIIMTYDSDYYADVYDFIRGVHDVCFSFRIELTSFGCSRFYSPQDFNKVHTDINGEGKWFVQKVKGVENRYMLKATSAGKGTINYRHPVTLCDLDNLRVVIPDKDPIYNKRKEIITREYVVEYYLSWSKHKEYANSVLLEYIDNPERNELGKNSFVQVPVSIDKNSNTVQSAIVMYRNQPGELEQDDNELDDYLLKDTSGIEKFEVNNYATQMREKVKSIKTTRTDSRTVGEQVMSHYMYKNTEFLQRGEMQVFQQQKLILAHLRRVFNNYYNAEKRDNNEYYGLSSLEAWNYYMERGTKQFFQLFTSYFIIIQAQVQYQLGLKDINIVKVITVLLCLSYQGYMKYQNRKYSEGDYDPRPKTFDEFFIVKAKKKHTVLFIEDYCNVLNLFLILCKLTFTKKNRKQAAIARKNEAEELYQRNEYPVRKMYAYMRLTHQDYLNEEAYIKMICEKGKHSPETVKNNMNKIWNFRLGDYDHVVNNDKLTDDPSINNFKYTEPERQIYEKLKTSCYVGDKNSAVQKNCFDSESTIEISTQSRDSFMSQVSKALSIPLQHLNRTYDYINNKIGYFKLETRYIDTKIVENKTNEFFQDYTYACKNSTKVNNTKSVKYESQLNPGQNQTLSDKFSEVERQEISNPTKQKMPINIGFESNPVYVKMNTMVTLESLLYRQFAVQTQTEKNIRDEGVMIQTDIIKDVLSKNAWILDAEIESFETYVSKFTGEKRDDYIAAKELWFANGGPDFTSSCEIFQKPGEALYGNKVRGRVIGDVISRSSKRLNTEAIHPKQHKSVCGWQTKNMSKVQKRIFLEYNKESETHIKFATGQTGEEIQSYQDDQVDRMMINNDQDTVTLTELDVSSMDACRNKLQREIEVIVYEAYGDKIQDKMDIPENGKLQIKNNILKIDNNFSYTTTSNKKRITHMRGKLTGTTTSGWPYLTSFANTVTMIVFGLLVQKRANTKKISIAAAGDNICQIFNQKETKEVNRAIRSLSCRKNMPVKKGMGLIIPDIRFTTRGTTFLSKVYYYKDCFTRMCDRISKTGDYTRSKQAETEEGKQIMRHCIATQLESTGGLNPLLGGYFETYKNQPSRQGKMSEKEELEKQYKMQSVCQQCNFTPYIKDFQETKQVLNFEPAKYYYKNLEDIKIGKELELPEFEILNSKIGNMSIEQVLLNKYNMNNKKQQKQNYSKNNMKNSQRRVRKTSYQQQQKQKQLVAQKSNTYEISNKAVKEEPNQVVSRLETNIGNHHIPERALRREIVKSHHVKEKERKYEEHLRTAISHFESDKQEYINTLLYPETFCSRIPFICPVPTAIATAKNVFTFNMTCDSFFFSFIPEAICQSERYREKEANHHFPFYYSDTTDSNQVTCTSSISRENLFPGFQYSSVSMMRVVGASIKIQQTQRLVDNAGFGITSRIYGIGANNDSSLYNTVSKSAIMNAVYSDTANFTDQEYQRMIYSPADFSDQHMKSQHFYETQNDMTLGLPAIHGFINGQSANNVLTIEFCTVIEYVPTPILYQMVERKPAVVNANKLNRAENVVAKTHNFKMDNGIDLVSNLQSANQGELFKAGIQLPKQERNTYLSLLNNAGRFIGNQANNLIPIVRNLAPIMPILQGSKPSMQQTTKLEDVMQINPSKSEQDDGDSFEEQFQEKEINNTKRDNKRGIKQI